MGFLEKLQKLNLFWKRVLVFGALFILAIPFLILTIRNFSLRMAQMGQDNFLEKLSLPISENESLSNASSTDFEGMLAELEALNQLLASTTDASSTDLLLDEDGYYIYEDEIATSSENEIIDN